MRDTIPSSRVPFVNYLLIAANAAAFLYQISLGEALSDFVYAWAVIPFRFLEHVRDDPSELLTLVSAMFLHGGWLHILGNMLYLYIFGDNVEDILGHGRFALFYLLCGVASFVVQLLFNAHSMVPNIGASGAIAGVLGAYLVLFPRAKVATLLPLLVFFTVVEVPAWIFLGFWFVVQFLSGAASAGRSALSGGVAWWAHVGGFVAGIVFLALLAPRGARGGAFRRFLP